VAVQGDHALIAQADADVAQQPISPHERRYQHPFAVVKAML
jgi:hypothetical protein